MIWLYCLISFCVGFLVAWLIGWIYVLNLLKKEKKAYLSEMKQSVKLWYLKPFPIIEILKNHKDQHREKVKSLKSSIRDAGSRLKDYSQTIRKQQSRLNELEAKNRDMQKSSRDRDNSEGRLSNAGMQSMEKKPLVTDTSKKVASSFFSIPEADGSFYMEKGESLPDNRKFYKISASTSSNTGELHFISGPYDLKAIENIDYYLIPVCEVENISERNSASKVLQKEAGRVVRISGKWMTDKKIKVKLI
jgi:hypothetical protein